MLSLARRPGQKIRIGDDIVLVVLQIRGRQVKLGIEAPSNVRVLREEIFEELKAANREAANAPADLGQFDEAKQSYEAPRKLKIAVHSEEE